jgi:hypothetical protein
MSPGIFGILNIAKNSVLGNEFCRNYIEIFLAGNHSNAGN